MSNILRADEQAAKDYAARLKAELGIVEETKVEVVKSTKTAKKTTK